MVKGLELLAQVIKGIVVLGEVKVLGQRLRVDHLAEVKLAVRYHGDLTCVPVGYLAQDGVEL